MNAPHKVHLEVAKQVLLYIKGIQKIGIFYETRDSNGLREFIDLDWARDCEKQKSTTCYLFQLGNGPIIWCVSNLQLHYPHQSRISSFSRGGKRINMVVIRSLST
jgi:hypothetical protein